ncbi:MAG: hypothetical protein J0I12_15875 [Candidatus Eremiobacteraeota bacterium]|nr:hypothetical protein [Candidatus Eremiobacteraeota bacterium]
MDFIDEHQVRICAPPDQVWQALLQEWQRALVIGSPAHRLAVFWMLWWIRRGCEKTYANRTQTDRLRVR